MYFDDSIEDVIERKRLEKELKTANEKEKRWREELEADAKSRAQFVNVLAHEVKTPLTALLGSARLLAEQFPPPVGSSQYRLMRNIITAADTLESRITELLDLAQLQAGFLPLNVTTFDILGLIEEMVGEFQPLAEKRNISCTADLPAHLPSVLADGRRLEQVLMKILTTAVKYSPPGGFIRFKAGVDDRDVVIKCWNTGPSIIDSSRIFDPYFRREADRGLPGLDIGLALCKELVEAHGGRIWVESGPRAGNTLSIALPLYGHAPDRITKMQEQ